MDRLGTCLRSDFLALSTINTLVMADSRLTLAAAIFVFSRLLKKTRLLRSARHLSLRRTEEYAAVLEISHALHLCLFEQPL